MTDLEVEARGKDLGDAFENAAMAIEDTMVDIASIHEGITKSVTIEERDVEALLYSWIEYLIIMQEVEGLLFSKFACKVTKTDSGFKLEAKASGEKFDPKKHEQKTAIKAPTYHAMSVTDEPGGTILKFLVDL
ncbi:MAG: archease [Nitrososphaerota archaeon]|nr:archease [Nitrososphaerota archaeon]